MKIKNLLINEELLKAELELDQANSDNIVELCRNYLLLLNAYRDQLYQLRDIPEINLNQQSSFGRGLIEQSRKAVRAALESTIRERNTTQSLLDSFTSISGYQAAETFNKLKYKGFDNWAMQSSGVRSKDMNNGEFMTVPEAVETAGQLRRDAYIENKLTFFAR